MRTCFVCVVLLLGLLVSGARAERIATVKANFDVGTIEVDGREIDLWYEDVHFKFKTLAEVWDEPVTYDVGGLGDGTATVTPPTGGDRFTHVSFDWSKPGAPVHGKQHFGGNFLADIDIGNQGYRAEYLDVSVTLTNVRSTDPGFSFYNNELKVQPPIDWEVEPDKSIDWTFAISNPDITGTVEFSNVRFYKTSVEPALDDLTAANFASIPTTLLLTVPDFVLAFGGERLVHVEDIRYPDWVIVYYETDWVHPDLTAANGGGPVSIHVDQWISTNVLEAVVPEPAALGLVGVVLIAMRKRRP